MDQLTIMPFIIGVALLFAGVAMRIFPPKNINGFYGYRTPASMSSQERWDFAQRFAARKSLEIGALMLVISGYGYFVHLDDTSQEVIGAILSAGAILALIGLTENAIRKNFPNL